MAATTRTRTRTLNPCQTRKQPEQGFAQVAVGWPRRPALSSIWATGCWRPPSPRPALAIDDFGTGYSSLASLKQFRVSLLKIDGSFIAGLPGDAENGAIVSAVIKMATGLGARTLAEG